MAKKINKHITDSEQLFKHLETGHADGLDDFEKEALEGFESLNNTELSKKLHTDLNTEIEEVYFNRKSKKNVPLYFSLAAGLLLVVGLSIFLYQYLNTQKHDLALNNSIESKEVLPDINSALKPAEVMSEEPKAVAEKQDLPNNPDNSRAATRLNKSGPGTDDFKLTEEDKNQDLVFNKTNSSSEQEKSLSLQKEEKPAPQKSETRDDNQDEAVVYDNAAKSAGSSNKDSRKNDADIKPNEESARSSTSTKKAKVKEPSAATKSSAPTSPSAGAAREEAAGDFSENKQNTIGQGSGSELFVSEKKYIKAEIEKNTILNNTVSAFVARLSINEKGKITKVKFISVTEDCKKCRAELEKILLDMPSWPVKQENGKPVKQQIDYSY